MKETESIFPHKGLHLLSKCCASVFHKLDSAVSGNSTILKTRALSETAYLLHCYAGNAKEFGFLLQ